MDVMFSTGIWVQPSPYNELCPFSAGPQNAQRRFSSTVECLQSIFGTHFSPVESEFEEHLCKLEKLRQLCPVNHEGLINEMWEVAFIYCAKKEFPKAEYWSRQLAQRPLLPTAAINSQLIKSRLLLSHVLFMQEKYQEARREYRIVHQLVLGALMVSGNSIEFILAFGGCISEILSENKDSELWYRQLAQLMLTTYGPRCEGTISALRYLSEVMLRQRRYSESEELLWILMDLAKTNLKSTDRAVTKVTYLLAKVLYNQKRFEDAEIWWRTSLEIAQKNWGSENSITLKAETGLAIALKAQKRLAESERLFRKNLEKIIKVRGENSLTASKSMKHLGSLLMEDGRCEDAVIWLEKCTKILLLGVGPTDAMSFKTFSFLTECYLQMGRYSDALKSCGEWLEAVKKVSGPGHRYVGQLEIWVENIVAEM